MRARSLPIAFSFQPTRLSHIDQVWRQPQWHKLFVFDQQTPRFDRVLLARKCSHFRAVLGSLRDRGAGPAGDDRSVGGAQELGIARLTVLAGRKERASQRNDNALVLARKD